MGRVPRAGYPDIQKMMAHSPLATTTSSSRSTGAERDHDLLTSSRGIHSDPATGKQMAMTSSGTVAVKPVDKRSWDYLVRSGLAGGLAGCAVSIEFYLTYQAQRC